MPGSARMWCAEASCRNRMYMKKAVRLTFSERGLAPTTMAPIAYQIETWAETLICWLEWPMPHQTTLYISVSMLVISPRDQNQVGIRMIAPEARVKTAMMPAVIAPKVTSGTDPAYVCSLLATTSVPKQMNVAI